MKVKNDHCSKFSNLSSWKEKPEKNQGFNGIPTHDLHAEVTGKSYCDDHSSPSGAMIHCRQLSIIILNYRISWRGPKLGKAPTDLGGVIS